MQDRRAWLTSDADTHVLPQREASVLRHWSTRAHASASRPPSRRVGAGRGGSTSTRRGAGVPREV